MNIEYTPQEIRQSHGPKIRFNGRLLAQTTMNTDGTKDKWFEAELWETVGGAWIVVSINRSDNEAHRDFVEASVLEPLFTEDVDRQCAVMDALQWGPCAHKIRRAMKWKLVKEVA